MAIVSWLLVAPSFLKIPCSVRLLCVVCCMFHLYVSLADLGGVPGARPQQDPILLFSHTFSPKSTPSEDDAPPTGRPTPRDNPWSSPVFGSNTPGPGLGSRTGGGVRFKKVTLVFLFPWLTSIIWLNGISLEFHRPFLGSYTLWTIPGNGLL